MKFNSRDPLLVISLAFFIVILSGTSLTGAGHKNDLSSFIEAKSSCGLQKIIPVSNVKGSTVTEPAILNAWTTNSVYRDPYHEVYEFQGGVDTLVLVTKYVHTGGYIPKQYVQGFKCGTDIRKRGCQYNWTIGPLPAGTYLLINYYAPAPNALGSHDWATRVGNVTFGYPDPSSTRPLCFTIY